MTPNNSEQTNQYPDLVSIIIPVYNTGSYLRETLDSCLNQNYRNIEVLAMDDNSNDPETLEILRTYAQKDPRVKVYRSEENHGVTYGRNRGVELCQGKYFCFLDHDDILTNDCIERLREAILKYDCDLAECSFQAFADSDYEAYSNDYRLAYIQSHAKEFAERVFDVVVYTRKDVLKSHLAFGLTKLCWAKLFITEKYRKAGLEFANVRYGEDIDWSIRMFLSFERYVSVRFIGLHYRLHPGAGSMGANGFFKGMNEAWKRVYDMLVANPEYHSLIPDLIRDLKKYVYYSYRFVLEAPTPEAKQAEIRYLVDLYRHCQVDLESDMKNHNYDFDSSIYWSVICKALINVPPEYVVICLPSLFDQDEPEMFYYLNLLDQISRQGFTVTAITSNANFHNTNLPQFKSMEQEISQHVRALNQSIIDSIKDAQEQDKNKTASLSPQQIPDSEHKFYIDAPYNALQTYVVKLTSRNLYAINQADASFIDQSLTNILGENKFIQAVVLIGQDPLTLSLAPVLKKTGEKILHLQLNRDQDTWKDEPWADVTTSLSKFGYLLPDYTRPKPDFSQRKYVTFLHPDCEHGLAILMKLIMLMKKRYPDQQFMLIQDQKNDLVNQLKLLHTAKGESLFALKPDLSNLKTMQQPEQFSKIWQESKALLMLSPHNYNCHGFTLESIYNYIPVLATHVKDEAPLGSINLDIPESTKKDITCLPEDEELEPYVQALEQLLKQSPAEIQSQCDKQVAAYQEADHFKAWMDLFKSFISQDKLRPQEQVNKPTFLHT